MSISESVSIAYVWDRDNFEKSFENAYTYSYKNSARRYIGWFFIALAQFGVVAALKGGRVGLLLFSSLLIVYWYFLKKRLLHRRALQAFEHSPLRDRTMTLTVTSEGIVQGKETIPWEAVDGVGHVGEDWVLYYQGKNFYIPENGFASPKARETFRHIAEAKGKLHG